jgi:PAS domain S-box-containing protein
VKQSRLVLLGIFLVAVPVLLQLTLLSGLAIKLWNIQQQCSIARESRNRITRLSMGMYKLSELSFLLLSGKGVKESKKRGMLVKEVEEIEREINELLDKGENTDPEIVEQTRRAREALHGLTALADWALKNVLEGKSVNDRMSVTPKVGVHARNFEREVSKLIELEKKNRQLTFEFSQSDRDNMRNWLLISIAASILISLITAIFFATRIKKPIFEIATNLKRLSNREPLLPALGGTDELGDLDRLIHAVASEVDAALERERSLIERAADLICSLDAGGVFLTANPMALRMLGIQPSDLVGKKLNELAADEDTFAADALVRKSISSNDFQSAELTIARADGTTVDTRWSCLWSDQEGSLFCIAHDISQEKELARVKQEFMSMISHDLRSPLTAVMAGLSVLTSGSKGELPPSMKEEAQSAVRSAEKLVGFISDLLDFQKLNVGKMSLQIQAVNTHDLIQEAIELISAIAKDRSIDLKVENESAHAMLECDGPKIVQVIVNLLSNALKFSADRSTVSIATTVTPDGVRISVIDRGPGIPDEMRLKIFEPFEQLASTQNQGTGLGLAICKMIVEAHHGEIGVREPGSKTNIAIANSGSADSPGETESFSNIGSGSEFWFTIPRVQPGNS